MSGMSMAGSLPVESPQKGVGAGYGTRTLLNVQEDEGMTIDKHRSVNLLEGLGVL